MFAARFFAPRYFPPNYFPEVGAESARAPYFPHGFFARRFFPDAYFPGAVSSPVTLTEPNYFPHGFFARSFFPDRYFPGPDGVAPPSPSIVGGTGRRPRPQFDVHGRMRLLVRPFVLEMRGTATPADIVGVSWQAQYLFELVITGEVLPADMHGLALALGLSAFEIELVVMLSEQVRARRLEPDDDEDLVDWWLGTH